MQIFYGNVSKRGRLRVLPVADEASNKEWQRSKFGEANSEQQILITATGHNGADSKHSRVYHDCISVNPLFIGVFVTSVCTFRILHLAVFSHFGIKALPLQFYMETYRSGDVAERCQWQMKRRLRSGRGRNFYTAVLKNFGHPGRT